MTASGADVEREVGAAFRLAGVGSARARDGEVQAPVGIEIPGYRGVDRAVVENRDDGSGIERGGGFRLTGVADPVAIGVGLAGVRPVRTVVTGVARPVPVGVRLRRVVDSGAVVLSGAQAVSVRVVPRIDWTRITGVSATVTVAIGLVGIRHERTVVTRASAGRRHTVRESVSIRVRALVARLSDAVMVAIGLQGVGDRPAIVAGIPPAIAVHVRLGGVR